MEAKKPKVLSFEDIYSSPAEEEASVAQQKGKKVLKVTDIYSPESLKERPATASDELYAAEGLGRAPTPEQTNPAIGRIKERFGPAYTDEPFVSEPGDLWITSKLGYLDSDMAKTASIQQKYPNGRYVTYDFGEDGQVGLITKDGKTWHEAGGLKEKTVSSIFNLENVASTILSGGPASAVTTKIVRPAIGAAIGAFIDQKIREQFDPEALDPYDKATSSFFENIGFGVLAEGGAAPLLRRSGIVKKSPGAEKAIEASEQVPGLLPLTKGQATSNTILQSQYKQIQNMYSDSRKEALLRYQSLGDTLKDWVDENWIDPTSKNPLFSKATIDALDEEALRRIESNLQSLSTGRTPFGEAAKPLKDALDIYNKTAQYNNNNAYTAAFDAATTDLVELDFKRVKNVFDEIEKGVPVKSLEKDLGTSDAIGAVGTGEGDPIRYLTPERELQTMIEKARGVADVLSVHMPDGDYVDALKQINAIRRGFSEFAWQNAENNQGRLATKVLDAIDESIANPVAGYSDAYKTAFSEAQRQYGEWRAIKEIKAISKLSDADVSTYQNYVVNLMKPGNGPLVELMDNMFKGSPESMDAVRNSYIEYLLDSPETLERTIDTLGKKDPKLFGIVFKNKNDEKILRDYAKQTADLETSWFAKQKNLEMLTEGQRALDLVSGNRDTMAKNLSTYIKNGGPNAKLAVQTALIHKIQQESLTADADLLGKPVADPYAFLAAIENNKDFIEQVFTPQAIEKLKLMESYALKIKDTAVGLPELKGSAGGGDMGTSLQVAGMAAKQGKAIEKAESKGPLAAAKELFSMWMSPYFVAKIINFDAPVKRRLGKEGVVSEDRLQSILNYSRVFANVRNEYQAENPEATPFDENVYTP